MKSILLIGLNHLGFYIAKQLHELGHEIMAIDKNEDRVNCILPFVTDAQIGDSTNELFLRSLGINNYDVCIVTIGGNFQSSLETTSLLKELGGKLVVSRADREVQAKFLLRNGTDEVLNPEKQIAEFAHISGITKIVIGRSGARRQHFWSKPPLTEQIILKAPDVDVYIIPDSAADLNRQKKTIRRTDQMRPTLKDSAVTALLLIASTLLGLVFMQFGFSEANIITVFILGVLVIFRHHRQPHLQRCKLTGQRPAVQLFFHRTPLQLPYIRNRICGHLCHHADLLAHNRLAGKQAEMERPAVSPGSVPCQNTF